MKARNPTEYKQAWQWHLDQLASLALAANIGYGHYVEVKKELESWLTDAYQSLVEKENGNGE